MLPFDDQIEALAGPKDARMEFRTKRKVKETIRAAAALSGVDDSAFAINAAYRAAIETIAAHERTVLSQSEREAFFAALDQPAVPTKKLRDAFAEYRRLIHDAG